MKSNEKFTQLAELAIENARAAAGGTGTQLCGHRAPASGYNHRGCGAGRPGSARAGHRRKQAPSGNCRLGRHRRSRRPGAVTQSPGTGRRGAAASEAGELRQGYIGTEHLLLGILRQSDCGGAAVLRELGADLNDLYTDILALFGSPYSNGRPQTGTARSTVRRTETRVLDQYSRDLTEMAAAGRIDPVVGRGRRDSESCADLVPPDKKQPRACWGAGCGQDGPWQRGSPSESLGVRPRRN